MNLRKAGLYVALGLGLLLVARLVVSTVLAIVGFVWAAVTTAVTLLILLGLAYGLYRGVEWLRDGGSGTDVRSADFDGAADPVDRVTEQYVEGDLSERELERRLDDTLDDAGRDEIDRELERSRSE